MITYEWVMKTDARRFKSVRRLYQFLSPDKVSTLSVYAPFVSAFANPFHHLLVAEDTEQAEYPERIIGMASITFQYTQFDFKAEINDVIVDPLYRGQGIGEELLMRLIAEAKRRIRVAGQELTLSLTSKPGRVNANNLYKKLGFTLAARATGKNGTNLYRMKIA